MKKVVILVVLFACMLSMASCMSTDVSHELALCGSYAVPGMFCSDLKGGSFSCNILEEDSQGRILYEYRTENIISGKEETVLLICQKIDTDYVFYYEDICYLLPGYSTRDIEQLKVRNDWDAPLATDKMSRRANKISFDLYIICDSESSYSSACQTCLRSLQVPPEQMTEFCILDADGHGNELYFLRTQNDAVEGTYFVLANSAYPYPSLEIEKGTYDLAEVASFKLSNGWQYGF